MAAPSSPRRPASLPDGRDAFPVRLSPILALAWLVPGGGHVLLGHARKGLIFLATLVVMFGLGLAFGGRLFPFEPAEPLVFLAAVAEWGLGLPRLASALLGLGAGDVVAVTYEYGNTFLIAGGLLNMLVVLDAHDLATGRKSA